MPRLMILLLEGKLEFSLQQIPLYLHFVFLFFPLSYSFINCFKASRIRYNHKRKNKKQVRSWMHVCYMIVIEVIVEVAFVPQLASAQQS